VNLLIVGCSRRKLETSAPVPALNLYEGWCVPALREMVAGRPDRLDRVRVLSARHGLLPAATPLMPYDQALTRARAARLRHRVRSRLRAEVGRDGGAELLLLLEPRYLRLLGLPGTAPRVSTVHWFTQPARDWHHVLAVLATWGWT
jgi:hypothetical protein